MDKMEFYVIKPVINLLITGHETTSHSRETGADNSSHFIAALAFKECGKSSADH
jgi:hypothetical protein